MSGQRCFECRAVAKPKARGALQIVPMKSFEDKKTVKDLRLNHTTQWENMDSVQFQLVKVDRQWKLLDELVSAKIITLL